MTREELLNGKLITDIPITHGPKFGGVHFEIPLSEFNASGFNFGDSIDIIFSNGEVLRNVPYYDNYYSGFDEPMLCGFPTFPGPRLAYNMTRDAWLVHKLTEGETASIGLNTPGGFADIQENMAMATSSDINDHENAAAFANFRAINTGHLAHNILYRSASPCDLEHSRNEYADKFMCEAGVKFVISLADTMEELKEYAADDNVHSPYFKKLVSENRIFPISPGINYRSEIYRSEVARAFTELPKHEGPYMVYCSLGKDRTGFICVLLQALCGATREEMEEDYMRTYRNFYSIDKEKTPKKYQLVIELYFNDMMDLISDGAEKYLLGSGMTSDAIDALKRALTA